MLGSRADAEDVVQDAWIRWRGVAALYEKGATAGDMHSGG